MRGSAAATLRRIGPAAKDAAPELARLLKDSLAGVRRGRRCCLGRARVRGWRLSPELVKLLNNPDQGVRRAVANALGDIARGTIRQKRAEYPSLPPLGRNT